MPPCCLPDLLPEPPVWSTDKLSILSEYIHGAVGRLHDRDHHSVEVRHLQALQLQGFTFVIGSEAGAPEESGCKHQQLQE